MFLMLNFNKYCFSFDKDDPIFVKPLYLLQDKTKYP